MSASRSERVEALRKRVAADPYDAAAWEDLVSEADRARWGAAAGGLIADASVAADGSASWVPPL